MSGPAISIVKVKRKLYLSKFYSEKAVNTEGKASVNKAFKIIGSEASPTFLTPNSSLLTYEII